MNPSKRLLYFTLAIFAIYAIFKILFTKVIEVNDGCGFDGVNYCNFASNFQDLLLTKKIDAYRIFRIVPSAICYYLFNFLGISITVLNIIRYFQILNSLSVLGCIFIWFKISIQMGWKMNKLALCYVSAILIQPLSYMFYNPVLTDTFAYLLASLAIYFYIYPTHKFNLLWLLLLSEFTLPSLSLLIVFLIIFPFKNWPVKFENHNIQNNLVKLVSLFIFGIVLIFSYAKGVASKGHEVALFNIVMPLLPLSVLTFAMMVAFSFYPILQSAIEIKVRHILRNIDIKSGVIAVLFFLLLQYIGGILLSHMDDTNTLMSHARRVSYSAIVRPFETIIDHISAFGPVFILMIYYWEKIIKVGYDISLGIFIILITFCIFQIAPESRQLITWYPIVLFLIIGIIDVSKWDSKKWAFIIIFSFICSKFWYPYNLAFTKGDPSLLRLFEFPAQHYFGHVGPWMGNLYYCIYLGLSIVMILMMLMLGFFKKPDIEGATPVIAF